MLSHWQLLSGAKPKSAGFFVLLLIIRSLFSFCSLEKSPGDILVSKETVINFYSNSRPSIKQRKHLF